MSENDMSSEEDIGFENEVSGDEEYAANGGSGSGSGSGSEAEEDYSDDGNNEHEDDDDDEEEEEEGMLNGVSKLEEMEELENEYKALRNMEQNLVHTLKRHKDEDLVKGEAIKSQKALWDKALEIRCIVQRAYSKSNKLPQETIRSLFCDSDEGVSSAYSDVIASSKKAIDALVHLQEALLDNNPSITRVLEEEGSQSSLKSNGELEKMDIDMEKKWAQISQIQSRVAPFRNKAIDKWQRKADVHSGAAAKKAKLLAFNQNISDQVATYMRDPSRMIKSMQTRRETIGVFGTVAQQAGVSSEEGNPEGDPELLDDSEFYQQLLKEFFETVDPSASEAAFYALKKLQTKKRKVVDRRASKSRKIRYNVHEKILNFMAPQPADLPPMASKLFENLFGLRTHKPTSAA